ncbi:hypothetical protein SDC9_193980 [bioreactor metagenome]|uniref:Uncharacterized protein n=1 Tax=bioreactor metagenome TaxID=1076179 RepID=A0A645IDM9_9ZZZZ
MFLRHIADWDAELLRQINFRLHAGTDPVAAAPQFIAFFKNGNSHIKPGLPLIRIGVIEELWIQEMGRKKSVPLVHYIAARFPGKLGILFDVPGIGGRHID